MNEPELSRRLASAAPAGPGAALRGRVLAAVASELDRPTPAIDRWLAGPLTWIAAALMLAGLGVGIFVQETASARQRAARRGPEPAVDRSFDRAVTELAGMDEDPAAVWIRGRLQPGTTAPPFGLRNVRRWLESTNGGDLR